MEEDDEEETPIAPRFTLSATDILTLGPSHHGFLRYEGGLERFVERIVILKPFLREAAKWRMRFVVLYEGCMYLYPDEYSRSPSKAFALTGFNSIKRMQESGRNDARRQRFMLVPFESNAKCLKFCSSSDAERKVWFQKIRKEMEFAVTGASQSRSAPDLDEYVSLEEPIQSANSYTKPLVHNQTGITKVKRKEEKAKMQKDKQKEGKGKVINKPLPSVLDNGGEESEDEYDSITEETRRPLPELPPEPAPSQSPPVVASRQLVKPIKPNVASKPINKKKTKFSRSEFEFNSSDRSKVEDILDDKDAGTFLVRKSRQDDQEVLSIKTTEGVKEYKIYLKQKGYSIDNKTQWFNTTEELLDFYAENDVPNRGLTLSRAYSKTDEGERL